MKSVELLEQRAKAVHDCRKILDTAEAEKRDMNAEERLKWDELMTLADDLKAKADGEQRREYLAAQEAEIKQPATRKVAPHKPNEHHDYDRYFETALRSWALGGTPYARFDGEVMTAASHCGINLNSNGINVRTAMSKTVGAGGYTVPTGFANKLSEALLWYAPIRNYCSHLVTDSGQTIAYPAVDNTALVASIVGEGSETTEGDAPTFTNVNLLAYKYSALRTVSIELLQDSAFDLQSWIARALGEMIGRAQEVHFVTGDNSSKPQGVVAASTVGVDLNTAAMTSDDIITLIHSVDVAYRSAPKCAFIMSDEVLSDVRRLKDDNQNYLWQPGMQAGVPDKLFGYPIHISNSVDDGDSTNEKMMAFGDLSQHLIRDVNGIELVRCNEKYIHLGQVGFYVFLRSDAKYVGPTAAVKHMYS